MVRMEYVEYSLLNMNWEVGSQRLLVQTPVYPSLACIIWSMTPSRKLFHIRKMLSTLYVGLKTERDNVYGVIMLCRKETVLYMCTYVPKWTKRHFHS